MILPVPAIGSALRIADADEAQSWAPGVNAWISGWGSTDDARPGTFPDHLLATNVTILGDARCALPDPDYAGYDAATSLCADATTGEHDTCNGDSGGPLVVSLPNGGASRRCHVLRRRLLRQRQ
jgi:hypothetical protein